MTDRFDTFIREKTFLQNLAPRTIKYYKESWNAFTRYKGEISEQGVKEFMMRMLESGMKPGSANAFARGMNVYFVWLKANKHTEEQFKVPLVKTEKRVLKTYKSEDMQKILNYHPEYFGGKRLMVLLSTLVDCGLRIDEALSLERKGVGLDNLLLTVAGKGRKERVVPFSRDLRKVLYKWLKEHNNALVFCTRQSDKLCYDNIRRDFFLLLDKVGVEKSEGAFHSFRRFFAREYTKAGCNLFYLQKMMGHTTLEMTRKYTDLETEDLQIAHVNLSPLSRTKTR